MKYTENLAMSKDLSLVDGVSFARTGSPRSARSYEPLADDPKARELQVEERILDNVVDFLDSHALQLRMPKAFEEDNSVDEEGMYLIIIKKISQNTGKIKKATIYKVFPLNFVEFYLFL